MELSPLSGIVLAGGASRRLGTDKALLRLWGDTGPTLLEAVVERLAALCDEVLVVADRPRPWPAMSARTVYDALPGSGVLGAIYTGLLACHTLHALVVACDMPFLNEPLLRYMASRPRDYDVLIPRLPADAQESAGNPERVEPLHAIYSRLCLEPMLRVLQRGERRIVSFFPSVRVQYLEVEEWTRFDPEGLSFRNLNTREDVAYARAVLSRKHTV
ncbi:MAG: molybdenum cofactor guanylyltransferase [Chloroflexia bacterium]